ncbi:MAG TPA: Nif3-like dinuclear metal center hexameric protein [Gemmatimonadaceae bacterium]|nr:Nif3-like dinuclear metal center hexameric protein [Gemmatimonadaceae bacterium]
MTIPATRLAQRLDEILGTREVPDYDGALNGLQCDHRGPVARIGAAVDLSGQVIGQAAARGINFLIVHHGMFWGGPGPLVGPAYERLRRLFEHDIAVYSSHLPLDAHPEHGNNVLLARALGLLPSHPFASFRGLAVGCAGETDLETRSLIDATEAFVRAYGGSVRASAMEPGRRTKRWAICTGAGASSETLREARASGIDTLIVGEGPHHTAVEAAESGVVILYAGHYATETLGVQSIASHIAESVGVSWEFLLAPTGL